jgi:nucleoside-diphosphate-sugar epimerase
MKIFLTGATGYIGGAVAERLRAAGHSVLGLARSEPAAADLVARGITPHHGDLADPASLFDGAREADGVIHLAQVQFAPGGDFAAQMQEMGRLATGAVDAILRALAGSGKPFILTGGTGAYGDTGAAVVDEDTPIPLLPMLASLAENDRKVLGATGVRGMAIRPAIVYGRGGGPVSTLVAMARQTGVVQYTGDGENLLSTVHVDDVAELYLLMLEGAPGGTLLNGVAEPFVSQRALLEGVSRAAGLGGAIEPMPEERARSLAYGAGGLFARNSRVSAARARALLGWIPRQPSVIDELLHGSYQADAATIR